MHYGDEYLVQSRKISARISQLFKRLFQSLQKQVVVVGLNARFLHIFLELRKRICVRALVALQKTENVFHLNRLQLIVD